MKVVKIIIKLFSFILIFLFYTVLTLYFTIILITHGPSKSARNLFTTTMLETGALKWMVKYVLPDDVIEEIVSDNSLTDMDVEVKTELIDINNETKDENKELIEIIPINGSNYYATLMIIHDPSKVKVASTYPFTKLGVNLKTLVEKYDAIGGINGGLYSQDEGRGGYPLGVLVQNNQIVWNKNGKGYVLVGFDNNNILKILSLDNLTSSEIEKLITNEGIRDAVTFQEEATDANNHFVKLIINGEERVLNGKGSGANPRTAIGQTDDGTVLMLVTDGRGANGHLGATAADLISIMKKYGAVNAANIDGGSSSSMYYNNEYLMTSTTLYYSNSSWRLPDAFIVSR